MTISLPIATTAIQALELANRASAEGAEEFRLRVDFSPAEEARLGDVNSWPLTIYQYWPGEEIEDNPAPSACPGSRLPLPF